MSKKNNPVIIKRETVEHWKKSNYVPASNVIIIMDAEDGSVRLMIGDGKTNVNLLPDIIGSGKSSEKESGPPLGPLVDEDNVLIL